MVELRRIERAAVWRRPRLSLTRQRLRHSEALLELVERCREQEMSLVPAQLWMASVRFLGDLDPELRDALGIDRHPDRLADCLFAAQEQLLARSLEERQPQLAEIIPLFGPRRAAS